MVNNNFHEGLKTIKGPSNCGKKMKPFVGDNRLGKMNGKIKWKSSKHKTLHYILGPYKVSPQCMKSEVVCVWTTLLYSGTIVKHHQTRNYRQGPVVRAFSLQH